MAKFKHPRIHSKEQLRDIVYYDPETGDILTKPQKIGSRQKSSSDWAYYVVHINGKQYLAHRLAWFLMTGFWPPSNMHVDHINGDSTDNRWSNLRLATPSENGRNRTRPNKNNTTGLAGAYYRKDYKRWISRFRDKHLGSFSTKEEAHEAYLKAAAEEYGDFFPKRFKR